MECGWDMQSVPTVIPASMIQDQLFGAGVARFRGSCTQDDQELWAADESDQPHQQHQQQQHEMEKQQQCVWSQLPTRNKFPAAALDHKHVVTALQQLKQTKKAKQLGYQFQGVARRAFQNQRRRESPAEHHHYDS